MMVDLSSAPIRILLVDDNPNNLKVLSEIIHQCGWKALMATDGESAIAQAEYAQPDLILLDVMMSGIDGFETCRRLKASLTVQSIPVIFMTALAETADKVKGLDLGAVDYISKPFHQEEVIARLKLHLKISHLTHTLEERVQDRTADLEQSLQELRSSEARFQMLADHLPGVIFQVCFNPAVGSFSMAYISSGCYDLYEVPTEAMISGQYNLRDFEHPEDQPRITEAIHQSVEHQTSFRQEFRIITPSGQVKWVQMASQPEQQTDTGVVWNGLIMDISERARLEVARKQAEVALAESEAKFRRLVEGANDVIWASGVDGTLTYLSPQFQTMFGFSLAEWVGQSFIALIHPDDLASMTTAVQAVAVSGDGRQNLEFRHLCQDGRYLWVTVNATPIKDGAGNVIGIQGIIRDISDRKAAEEQLRQQAQQLEQANQSLENYSQTLEQRVGERTAELKTIQERIIAQEKLAFLGTLTAGVAHELRNPLNFVKNYAESSIELAQDLLEALQPLTVGLAPEVRSQTQQLLVDVQENAYAICHHSDRAEKIVASMMQHTHVSAMPVNLQATDLHTLLHQSIKLASHSKRAQDPSFNPCIQTDYDPSITTVDLIEANFSRAIINLIENAYDAMLAKQQQLSMAGGGANYKPKITVITRTDQTVVTIQIQDNGCGIPPQIQTRVLEPFFTTKPPGEGTGLGLSITYDIIVNQHQGQLSVESVVNQFTEFTLRLPVKAAPL